MSFENKLISYCLSLINNYYNYSDKELEKIKYGLEGLYLTFIKLIVILILSYLFRIFDYVIYTLIFFNIIRYFAFGYHARTSLICLLMSIFLFIIVPLITKSIGNNHLFILFIYIFSFINILLFAPADTKKRRFYDKKKILIRKYLSIVTCIIFITLSCFLYDKLSISILNSLLIESIVINPMTYKIFK